jgi:hypothetical protein
VLSYSIETETDKSQRGNQPEPIGFGESDMRNCSISEQSALCRYLLRTGIINSYPCRVHV